MKVGPGLLMTVKCLMMYTIRGYLHVHIMTHHVYCLTTRYYIYIAMQDTDDLKT